jgi:hypothetical protein
MRDGTYSFSILEYDRGGTVMNHSQKFTLEGDSKVLVMQDFHRKLQLCLAEIADGDAGA